MPKDYLSTENARNKAHAALYVRMIRLAFGDKDSVMIGHHLTFEVGDNLDTLNEIPSADTLLFDHTAMRAIFGASALSIMAKLSQLPVDTGERDSFLEASLNFLEGSVQSLTTQAA